MNVLFNVRMSQIHTHTHSGVEALSHKYVLFVLLSVSRLCLQSQITPRKILLYMTVVYLFFPYGCMGFWDGTQTTVWWASGEEGQVQS